MAHREYMVREGLQQFRDYYETDAEEVASFEYLDNLSNRDRIRFMEVFDDFTIDRSDNKQYAMIRKREFNPELSAVSNMMLDMVDFRDRVRPLAKDLSLMDVANKYQRYSTDDIEQARREMRHELGQEEPKREAEISAESDIQSAAEPDYEQAAEKTVEESVTEDDEVKKE